MDFDAMFIFVQGSKQRYLCVGRECVTKLEH